MAASDFNLTGHAPKLVQRKPSRDYTQESISFVGQYLALFVSWLTRVQRTRDAFQPLGVCSRTPLVMKHLGWMWDDEP